MIDSKVDPNLRIIDAHNRWLAIMGDQVLSQKDQKTKYDQLDAKQKADLKQADRDWWQAIEDGACMIFGISHNLSAESERSGKADSFFTRVSMRKGPGDITKGSFKQ